MRDLTEKSYEKFVNKYSEEKTEKLVKIMEAEKERFWQTPDMTVTKTVIVEGDLSLDLGTFGSVIEIEVSEHDFEGVEELESKLQDNCKMTLCVGLATSEAEKALEQAVISMYPGEKGRFDMSFEHQTQWKTVHFVAERKPSSENESISKWSPQRKLDFAQKCYDSGVECIKHKQYHEAFQMFKQAAALSLFSAQDQSCQEEATSLKSRSLSNLTLCQKNLEKYAHVIEGIDHILQEKVNNEAKLLARRGHAHLKVKNYEKAIEDLTKSIELEPGNKVTSRDLKQARSLLKNHEAKLGNAMKKMFG